MKLLRNNFLHPYDKYGKTVISFENSFYQYFSEVHLNWIFLMYSNIPEISVICSKYAGKSKTTHESYMVNETNIVSINSFPHTICCVNRNDNWNWHEFMNQNNQHHLLFLESYPISQIFDGNEQITQICGALQYFPKRRTKIDNILKSWKFVQLNRKLCIQKDIKRISRKMAVLYLRIQLLRQLCKYEKFGFYDSDIGRPSNVILWIIEWKAFIFGITVSFTNLSRR